MGYSVCFNLSDHASLMANAQSQPSALKLVSHPCFLYLLIRGILFMFKILSTFLLEDCIIFDNFLSYLQED